MQCPSCFLRYNLSARRPHIITCGHTLCYDCFKSTNSCKICQKLISPSQKETINYSLLQIIQPDIKQIDKYIKVCFVGSTMTGKTSLIKRLMNNEFVSETVTTIGYDFSFQDKKVDTLNVRYQLWDSAGQEKYRAISPIHYKNADIVVIVYDTTQTANQNKVKYWIDETLVNCNQNVKVLIVGNKTDLTVTESVKNFNPLDQLARRYIQNQGFPHLKVSCKTGSGVDAFWQSLDDELRKILRQKKKSTVNFAKDLEQVERKKQQMIKIKNKNQERARRNNDSCC